MSLYDDLGYMIGQCTDFVAQTVGYIPKGLGDAGQWLTNAPKAGLSTTTTPEVGDVAVWLPNTGFAHSAGHVAIVTGVSGNTVTVKEQNWTYGPGITDTRQVPVSQISGYIQHPGTGDVTAIGHVSNIIGGVANSIVGGSDPVGSLTSSLAVDAAGNIIKPVTDIPGAIQNAAGAIEQGFKNTGRGIEQVFLIITFIIGGFMLIAMGIFAGSKSANSAVSNSIGNRVGGSPQMGSPVNAFVE